MELTGLDIDHRGTGLKKIIKKMLNQMLNQMLPFRSSTATVQNFGWSTLGITASAFIAFNPMRILSAITILIGRISKKAETG
jgi:hypothetical protein